MPGELTTMEDDIRGALQELQTPSRTNLPAERQPAQDDGERLPAKRREESLPANREQEAEDEREHPDERDEEAQPAVRTPTRAPAALETPPVAWKGPLKDEWKSLSEPVRREIQRREREIAQTLSRTDEERRYANAIYSAIKPYEHHILAENSNHVQAVQHLFQMSHIMRSGSVAQKADLIAELFFRHDVPIIAVDDALKRRLGGGQPAPADPVRQALQQELQPIREFMNSVAQTRARSTEKVATSAQQEWTDLQADSEIGDLLEDVREDIADILDIASKRGRVVPLRDAAVRAIMAHDELGPIYQQRQLDKKAQELKEKANKSRRAGASLEDDGAPTAQENDDDDSSLEADLRSSIRQLNRQRR